jgi:hypothetical protein
VLALPVEDGQLLIAARRHKDHRRRALFPYQKWCNFRVGGDPTGMQN